MSEHDEAGSACAFPPLLLLPPPPQPAARSASTAVRPISAASNGLLLTLPPRSPIPGAFAAGARARRREWGSIGRFHRLMQAPTGATVALRRSGGTGRRAGLKIRCLHGRVGSSPTFGIARAKAGAFARIRGWSLRGKRARAEPARSLVPGGCSLPCDASTLRVLASHRFACA